MNFSNITHQLIQFCLQFGPKMKDNSKLKVLGIIGFIYQKFDGHKFERSCILVGRSLLVHLLIVTALIKWSLCLLYDKNDLVQLYIGSIWNRQNNEIRLCMGFEVSRFWLELDKFKFSFVNLSSLNCPPLPRQSF